MLTGVLWLERGDESNVQAGIEGMHGEHDKADRAVEHAACETKP